MPLPRRFLTAAMLRYNGSSLLIDCGEGTQVAIKEKGLTFKPIDVICFTHYHGDHIFGLPGIWQTMAAQGRTAPLVMAGPPGLTDVVRTFYAVAGPLPFELRLKELPDCKGEFEVPAGCVQAFPLKHRVPCCGYAFTLPRAGKFDPQRAKAAGIAMCVATSTPAELVQSALAGAGIDAYMEFVTTTGEAGRSKQFPDVYELALRRLEERHRHKFERVWVFEDAVFGLKSSGVAGFKRVGIYDPHGRMKRDDVRANCDIFIDSYEELDLTRVLSFEG